MAVLVATLTLCCAGSPYGAGECVGGFTAYGHFCTANFGQAREAQTLRLPGNVTSALVSLQGGHGGHGYPYSEGKKHIGGAAGGEGGHVFGVLHVPPGEQLTIAAGEAGGAGGAGSGGAGGWPGGGGGGGLGGGGGSGYFGGADGTGFIGQLACVGYGGGGASDYMGSIEHAEGSIPGGSGRVEIGYELRTEISGRVITPSEEGLGEVTVQITGRTDGGEAVSEQTKTDAEGYYSFRLEPGTYGVSPVAENLPAGGDEFEVERCEGTPGPGSCEEMSLADEQAAVADFNAGYKLSGQVLNDSGAGVPGVTLQIDDTTQGRSRVSAITTNGEGRFEERLAPGTAMVLAKSLNGTEFFPEPSSDCAQRELQKFGLQFEHLNSTTAISGTSFTKARESGIPLGLGFFLQSGGGEFANDLTTGAVSEITGTMGIGFGPEVSLEVGEGVDTTLSLLRGDLAFTLAPSGPSVAYWTYELKGALTFARLSPRELQLAAAKIAFHANPDAPEADFSGQLGGSVLGVGAVATMSGQSDVPNGLLMEGTGTVKAFGHSATLDAVLNNYLLGVCASIDGRPVWGFDQNLAGLEEGGFGPAPSCDLGKFKHPAGAASKSAVSRAARRGTVPEGVETLASFADAASNGSERPSHIALHAGALSWHAACDAAGYTVAIARGKTTSHETTTKPQLALPAGPGRAQVTVTAVADGGATLGSARARVR